MNRFRSHLAFGLCDPLSFVRSFGLVHPLTTLSPLSAAKMVRLERAIQLVLEKLLKYDKQELQVRDRACSSVVACLGSGAVASCPPSLLILLTWARGGGWALLLLLLLLPAGVLRETSRRGLSAP
jgi:hypothetical protein